MLTDPIRPADRLYTKKIHALVNARSRVLTPASAKPFSEAPGLEVRALPGANQVS
jgi:hypothetical protein